MVKHTATRKRPTKGDKEWLHQATSAVKFIEKLHKTPSIHGQVWTQKMVAHYAMQYRALSHWAPRSCKKQAIRLDERVNIVVHAVMPPE